MTAAPQSFQQRGAEALALANCPFCGMGIKHVESWARSFDPPRLYHEWHHPENEVCWVSRQRTIVESSTDNQDSQAAAVARWNTRAASGDVRAAVIEGCRKACNSVAERAERLMSDPKASRMTLAAVSNGAMECAEAIAALSQSPATDAAARRDEIARIIDEHSFDTVKMHGRQNASQQSVRRLDDALAKADLILGGSHD